ncbi:hypothetical protein [Microbacterium thalassium]|uniref:Uncharacterized protein n=1 Tax=Microbacterium thalassium TaxID=362649 RepID=A0A7X0KUZ9_9MICO|nr:hypothetical protein [Microbacterium thalassium]MBB6391712.1 hypothetical protein [Microbacterium thalassium]GLK24315.1 hypothetical protein GCM10017607_16330 [Microbacterium thalassium]
MADLLVEIHVPLIPAEGVGEDDYPFPWIETIETFLFDLEDGDRGEMYDDGEELGGEYLFFVWGAPEDVLIDVARDIANLRGVPEGTYARVSDTGADMGEGRRVAL